jgi:putative phosphotransacetylase
MYKDEIKEEITMLVLEELKDCGLLQQDYAKVPVSISARHLHLNQGDLEALFGRGYELTLNRYISQPGQFASNERVTLISEKGRIENVRVLGPLRSKTQIELSKSDARVLGIKPVVRSSGDLNHTPGVILEGPRGRIVLKEGVIIPDRHIHMTPRDAENYGVEDGQKVSVKVDGTKGGILSDITIRVNPRYKLDFHIDTDDANAFFIENGDKLELLK